jgi:hypothetical protein
MTALRRAMMALLAVAMLAATGMAGAASTTNFSDQWWIENESGWGASVLQQSDVLFIDLFVYGTDSKPTWFTAAAFLQGNAPAGRVRFTGDLYSTTGPYYGGTFNPAAVSYAKVGTLTFDADSVNTATLTYTVGGVPVAKNVTRQTWRNENIGGQYYGGLVYDQTSCTDALDNGHFEIFAMMQFTHLADNTVTINAQITSGSQNGIPLLVPAGLVFTMSGKYTQSGHMGQMQGTSSVIIPGEPPDTSVVNLFEIERSISGITGRYNSVDDKGSCRSSGHLGGVLR